MVSESFQDSNSLAIIVCKTTLANKKSAVGENKVMLFRFEIFLPRFREVDRSGPVDPLLTMRNLALHFIVAAYEDCTKSQTAGEN